MNSIVSANCVSVVIKDKGLINDVSLTITEGDFTAIIGPNGAGKTTLFNVLNGDITPSSGSVMFKNQPLNDMEYLPLAQARAVLPQLSHIPFAIRVIDVVDLGREPYRFSVRNTHNTSIVQLCMRHMDIEHLANHYYATLSGGEQHRVQIARTLAQIYHHENDRLSGKVLFLDEPTNHLDIRHQYELMACLKQLQKKGLTIVAVMHDLSLTLQFANHICLLNQGRMFGKYSSKSLVDSDDLSKVYNMFMQIKWDADAGRYLIIPQPS